MRRLLYNLTAGAAVLALAATVSASQTPGPSPSAKPAKATAAKPAGKSATGKIAKFDDASKTLTITTGKGEESFTLADTATLHEGAKTITTADLGGLAGHTAKIRYTEAGGKMTAESVTVAGGKTASAKPAAKKPAADKK
jgi:hypothetical protein